MGASESLFDTGWNRGLTLILDRSNHACNGWQLHAVATVSILPAYLGCFEMISIDFQEPLNLNSWMHKVRQASEELEASSSSLPPSATKRPHVGVFGRYDSGVQVTSNVLHCSNVQMLSDVHGDEPDCSSFNRLS